MGCGPGSREYLMPAAWAAAKEADVLIGSRRLLDLFDDLAKPRQICPGKVAEAIAVLEKNVMDGRRIGLLVSGDPGVFSLATAVKRHFGPSRCRVVPGISAAQLAFARLGLEWASGRIISAHGREPGVRPEDLKMVSPIAVLCGGHSGRIWVSNLVDELKDTHQAWICTNLGMADETIRPAGQEPLMSRPLASLTVVVLVLQNTEEV
ncbi:MAG: precorrin-6y C5,15-methyltransferase (decarboxylating) subunit CbiE [Desulfosalsimonadaceae bacterium]|nr:precorrin-6y C5,15-methyltransferase (decarboxylating) subunit CbiE [Desulfosalsimonadaceae bacterium]